MIGMRHGSHISGCHGASTTTIGGIIGGCFSGSGEFVGTGSKVFGGVGLGFSVGEVEGGTGKRELGLVIGLPSGFVGYPTGKGTGMGTGIGIGTGTGNAIGYGSGLGLTIG